MSQYFNTTPTPPPPPPHRSSSLPCHFISVVTHFSCLSSREQKRQFQELVEVKFHEWLLETGNRQELDSLIPPTLASPHDSNGSGSDPLRVNDTTHIRNGPTVGQSPMAC